MLRSYLKIALRNLQKHPMLSLINSGGLAVGLAGVLLIVQFVWFERSFDRQSPHADQIWRVYIENYTNGTLDTRDANSHSAIGPALKAQLPEVVDYTRLYNARDLAVFRGQTPLLQQKAYAADEGFLRMFAPELRSGQVRGALSRPFTVVLTASAARRYFGNENPVGKTLRMAGGWFTGLHTVTAVVDDPPAATHFHYEMLLSYQTLYSRGHSDNWENYWDYNYVQLHPSADPARVQRKLAELGSRHLKGNNFRLRMQALTDIHLHSDLTYEHEPNGSARIVSFLMGIAAVILLLAWINYSNLTTARSLVRAKEVAMRKIIGANRRQLVGQFLGEAFLMNAVAVGLAIGIVQTVGPVFDELTGRPLTASGFLDSPVFGLTVAGLFLMSVLGSGLYPSLVLSGYEPLMAFRFTGSRSGRGWRLRQMLVVGQFVCTVVLLIATLTIYRQLTFMQNHDLGLSIDQTLVVRAPLHDYEQDSIYRTKFAVFQAETARLPALRRMAASSVVPGAGVDAIGGTSNGVYWKKRPANNRQTFYFVYVDEAFMNMFGVRQLAGSGFRANDPQWRNRYLLNRSAQKALGFPSPAAAVNETLVFGSQSSGERTDNRIVGVVDDFHIESLKTPTRPTLYLCAPSNQLTYLSFKLDPSHLQASLDQMNQIWKRIYPESPFDFFFLDQKFDQQYRSERQFSQLFSLFTGLAVLIACLGLLGLAAFAAEQRTKEIGIRKVLGASVSGIVALLSKDFMKLVAIAFVLACPLGGWVMHRWLRDFAYRVDLEWWTFALAGALAVGIALLTVAYQAVKAALMNPVKSLRTE